MIKNLIKKNRSYRRFHQDRRVDVETLRELVDLARLSGSAANLQPLRYILACDPQINAQIFACLGWAAYLKNWPGPKEGEQPPAYIIILSDIAKANDYVGYDCGIAGQSILLGAVEKGLAGCMLGSINRKKLKDILNIETQFKILLVIALGEPKEEVVIETVGHDNNIRYWRDDKEIHHVPKRELSDIIVASF
ncbi:MAG: nitroreductase family protein [Desulfobacterales bacterium]|uniref:Nitroreductase family protein n=1 Tax=Candidatus Desulfatibia vada TaxID=2841696 RepID=A0A8J6TSI3_9BACT|nr:nitroreductase family protein [Candidatus Desulfatibia vada]MBL6970918.1 nitroreductase family protein [Desulfobacterales bacterium]